MDIFADCKGTIGHPSRTSTGQLTITALEIPRVLGRSLDRPDPVTDDESKIRQRARHLLTNAQDSWKLRLSSAIRKHFRTYLEERGFEDHVTPILADEAGGASARAFVTRSTEFPARLLNMRVAPELWLKRLVMGGMDKVYEIGPCFRNEGLDRSHNPEFTMCEFYQVGIGLSQLMDMTKDIFISLSRRLKEIAASPEYRGFELPSFDFDNIKTLDFIPAIEAHLGQELPDLGLPDASAKLIEISKSQNIDIGEAPTLPHLLDKLGSAILDPQCDDPTLITHFPECLSPLAKTFIHPHNGQRVTANADFIVRRMELVNICEEENDPSEQRRKLETQARYRFEETGEHQAINEAYLEAMRTGLPPTGGFGCGLDRLAMLMTDSWRLRDVLTFGTLRNTAHASSASSKNAFGMASGKD